MGEENGTKRQVSDEEARNAQWKAVCQTLDELLNAKKNVRTPHDEKLVQACAQRHRLACTTYQSVLSVQLGGKRLLAEQQFSAEYRRLSEEKGI